MKVRSVRRARAIVASQVATVLIRFCTPVRNAMWMKPQPSQPKNAGQLDGAGLQQGVAAADVGRRAEVAVPVVLAGLAREVAPDARGDVQAALHGVLRHARQLVAADQIADDEDFGCPGTVRSASTAMRPA